MTKNKTKRSLSAKATENLYGYLFILPNLIGFLVFTAFGIVFSLAMSFTDWNLMRGLEDIHFVGLDNFKAMIGDRYLTASLINNALLLLVIPVTLLLAAILASLMNRAIYGKTGARALYFLPYVTNAVAVATVWAALFHKTGGPVNMLLRLAGIPEESLPGWIASSKWALPALMIIILWQNIGYDILMYSGALQHISSDLYEAADIDGAGAVAKFFRITIPMLNPTTFMLMILGIINSLQSWSLVQIMTGGGPGTATYVLGLYIYRSAFTTYRTGYACALSWLLCLIIFLFTLVQWQGQKKWTNE